MKEYRSELEGEPLHGRAGQTAVFADITRPGAVPTHLHYTNRALAVSFWVIGMMNRHRQWIVPLGTSLAWIYIPISPLAICNPGGVF